MPRFLFRAQAALDLRRSREDEAQRARGDAQAALERAESSVADAESALTQTLEGGLQVQDPGERLWYRNWIAKQRQDITRRRAMAVERRKTYETAVATAQLAHRDVRALERLCDKARAAWQLAERREEQKALDWLGCVRYTQQRISEREEDR